MKIFLLLLCFLLVFSFIKHLLRSIFLAVAIALIVVLLSGLFFFSGEEANKFLQNLADGFHAANDKTEPAFSEKLEVIKQKVLLQSAIIDKDVLIEALSQEIIKKRMPIKEDALKAELKNSFDDLSDEDIEEICQKILKKVKKEGK